MAVGQAEESTRWWHRPTWRRALLVARFVVGLGLAALALEAVLGQRGELNDAADYLAGLRWQWAVVAAAAELAAVVAFAGLQGRLLRSGGVRVGLRPLTGITLAGNAINNSLPGGPAFASIFAFRQFRRRGADDALAGWTIVATTVLAALALALLAALGVGLAGGRGNAFGLIGTVVGVLALAAAVTVLLRRPQVLRAPAVAAVTLSRRVTGWPGTEPEELVAQGLARILAVSPGRADLARALAWALGNWVFDCACLVAAFLALGAPVPWRALLLAYGAGQLAANLPITPGGLGVVEGSLTIALVAFGGARPSTVAAVLLYRIVSFWAALPVGWGVWAFLVFRDRRQDRREDRDEPVGPVSEPEGVGA
ncbi:MAG: lysylphosphatidylglycerol synthase transmembrane domain-containing protein [Acidimicrobiales bacterium]